MLEVDEDVMVADLLTDQEILNQVSAQTTDQLPAEDEDDEDDIAEEPAPPNYKTVQDSVLNIRRFIESKPDALKELSMLESLDNKLSILAANSVRQTKISEYFN